MTPAQTEALKKIKEAIKIAKENETLKEYYVARNTQWAVDNNRKDIDEIKARESFTFDTLSEKTKEIYRESWENARNENIALTIHVSSSTLRVLEKLGFIQIIKDGRRWVDQVKLIKE